MMNRLFWLAALCGLSAAFAQKAPTVEEARQFVADAEKQLQALTTDAGRA